MRIGEVAERTQTPVDTIRYYERLGMLPKPGRTASNYRAYTPGQVERLNFIRRCRGLDMSLQEIRALLVFCDQPQQHCRSVNEVLDEHIRHVDERISQLRRLAKELRELRGVCRSPGTAADCQILNQLRHRSSAVRKTASSGRRARASHG
ncbi:MAG: Cd(II)/Pb(II)-responsive transcriptional regulator [Burkholderiaceae bacterium]|nr:Cd(II)/Pb(II)-responsive transcriptional regulator [Burkholderiaceae bacterium]